MKKVLLLFTAALFMVSCSVEQVEDQDLERSTFTGCAGSGWQVFKASNGN